MRKNLHGHKRGSGVWGLLETQFKSPSSPQGTGLAAGVVGRGAPTPPYGLVLL